jgi:hypothetical protein
MDSSQQSAVSGQPKTAVDRPVDPRIEPLVQMLADYTFTYLLDQAETNGIPLMTKMPFDEADERIGNVWKKCIADFLAPLLPPMPDAQPGAAVPHEPGE